MTDLTCLFCGQPVTAIGHVDERRDRGHRAVAMREFDVTSELSRRQMEEPGAVASSLGRGNFTTLRYEHTNAGGRR